MLAETRRLEREGRLDAAALLRLDARMQAAKKLLEDETAATIARALADADAVANPRRPPVWVQATTAVVMLAVIVGIFLEFTFGASFLFAWADSYFAAAPWIFLALLFPLGGLFAAQMRRNRPLRPALPRARAPSWLSIPLAAIIAAAALLFAPLGWIALYGALAGTPAEGLEARLLDLAEPSPGSRSCRQHGEIALGDATGRLCLAGLVAGPLPPPGARVRVSGRLSAAGLFVQRIEP